MRTILLSFFALTLFIANVFCQAGPVLTFHSSRPVPAGDKGKSLFNTGEYVYARAELGTTVKEYFKIEDAQSAGKPQLLIFNTSINYTDKNGEKTNGNYWQGYYLYLRPEDLAKTYIEMDVLPDPALATDVFCMVSNFQGGFFTNPAYNIRLDEYMNNTPVTFNIVLTGGTTTASGAHAKQELPKVKGSFDLLVNTEGAKQFRNNMDIADKKIQKQGLMLSALPPIFSKPFKTTDPKLNTAKLTSILKRDYPHRKVLKMALDSDGGPLWLVAKNSLGIPRYRYFNGILHIAYMLDGQCYVGTVELIEQYQGGGRYGTLAADYSSEYDRKINCTAIK